RARNCGTRRRRAFPKLGMRAAIPPWWNGRRAFHNCGTRRRRALRHGGRGAGAHSPMGERQARELAPVLHEKGPEAAVASRDNVAKALQMDHFWPVLLLVFVANESDTSERRMK